VVARVRAAGLRVGVALKPATAVTPAVHALVPTVDMVLVMTVEPGFGGQAFMPAMLPKVAALRAHYPRLDIEVDGGLGPANVAAAAAAGANMIVAGSSVFNAADPGAVIRGLRAAVDEALQAAAAVPPTAAAAPP
jgi:ribulose-phosphate 3-epimerase